MSNDNISAISTALGASGVAVIRISGSTPLSVAQKMFKASNGTPAVDFVPNVMYAGEIICDGFTDYGMCVYFKAPKSFTGEDTVEFHCHGGIAITQGVLRQTLKSGARLATNGEFTKRAFVNGKLSLSSAEGLIDMINSESLSGVRAGYYLYRENLCKQIEGLQDDLTDALSEIDADMDFPEEDLEVKSYEVANRLIDKVICKLEELKSTYRSGRKIKNGVNVGIVGKPNTGKSSILNALLNYDKAIVSSVAGTTRDVVEGCIEIKGVKFNLSDTAGIRDSEDEIESIGVDLSKRILETSDLILFVMDGSDKDSTDDEIYSLVKDKNLLTVLNKTDKGEYFDERADLSVSALTKNNIDVLRETMYSKTVGQGIDLNGDFLTEERHYESIVKALERLQSAKSNMDDMPLDVIAIDIKDAWDALGEISGKTATEEIINNIFSKFCVGK